MATPAHHPIQDQNLNLLYSSAAPGGKTNNVSKQDKKGGIGGARKALNDISNSRRPSSVVHSTKKTNIFSFGNNPPCEAKNKLSEVAEKGKASMGRSRKALNDLTNSVKPSSQLVSKAGQKFNTGENFPTSLADERFLHDHQKCIGANVKAVEIDYFLETVGLKNSDIQAHEPSPKKAEISTQRTKLDEIPEPRVFKTQESQCKNSNPSGSPLCQSPKSPRPPYMNWGNELCSDLTLIESPSK